MQRLHCRVPAHSTGPVTPARGAGLHPKQDTPATRLPPTTKNHPAHNKAVKLGQVAP